MQKPYVNASILNDHIRLLHFCVSCGVCGVHYMFSRMCGVARRSRSGLFSLFYAFHYSFACRAAPQHHHQCASVCVCAPRTQHTQSTRVHPLMECAFAFDWLTASQPAGLCLSLTTLTTRRVRIECLKIRSYMLTIYEYMCIRSSMPSLFTHTAVHDKALFWAYEHGELLVYLVATYTALYVQYVYICVSVKTYVYLYMLVEARNGRSWNRELSDFNGFEMIAREYNIPIICSYICHHICHYKPRTDITYICWWWLHCMCSRPQIARARRTGFGVTDLMAGARPRCCESHRAHCVCSLCARQKLSDFGRLPFAVAASDQ